jgi:hypothetical protein
MTNLQAVARRYREVMVAVTVAHLQAKVGPDSCQIAVTAKSAADLVAASRQDAQYPEIVVSDMELFRWLNKMFQVDKRSSVGGNVC